MKASIFYILMFIGVLAVGACDSEDRFTVSSGSQLTFSEDTVRLDTVFSTVPSSTRSFWVYNKGKDGLRCTSVRLEDGAHSGFRVNVDGVYLSQEQGHTAYNIEVRGKDSIRVFVELTALANGGDVPKRIGDNLVFALENGREQKVALDAWSWDARFLRNLTVDGVVTLPSDKPLVVYGKIKVDKTGVLNIPAGATLYFHDNAGIDVDGRLVCSGTPGNVVTLRGDRLDRMFDYLPYDRASGQWQGVRFGECSYGNDISFTDLHGAFTGIRVDSSDVDRQTLSLRNSTVHNCQGNGVYVVNSNVVIENCQLTNALGYCLAVDGGNVSVNGSTIAQFYPFSALRGEALFFSGAEHPLVSFKVTNTLVTGYSDDEMVCLKPAADVAGTFVYSFANCILRTPDPDDVEKPNYTDVTFEDVEDTVSCGSKHFVLVDAGRQLYDFHLRKESAAIGKANPESSPKSDHDGRARDDRPDIGAYEYAKPEE